MENKYINLAIRVVLVASVGGVFFFSPITELSNLFLEDEGVRNTFLTIFGVIVGGSTGSSVLSSFIKDDKMKNVMKLVNLIGCNIDKAKNDKKSNS